MLCEKRLPSATDWAWQIHNWAKNDMGPKYSLGSAHAFNQNLKDSKLGRRDKRRMKLPKWQSTFFLFPSGPQAGVVETETQDLLGLVGRKTILIDT